MENELNRLIEQQNKEYEKQFLEVDDDAQSNVDIDEFEQKLKMNKSRMGFDDDDSDDDIKPSPVNKKKPVSAYQPSKQTKPILSQEPDLMKQVNNTYQNKNKTVVSNVSKSSKGSDIQMEVNKQKQDSQQRMEEEKLIEALNSNNSSLKDKKLKELIQRNKELYVNLEREKTMRVKLQKELDKIKEETDMHLAAMEGKFNKDPKKSEESDEWKKKYYDLDKKYQEVKLQSTTLKNDLNKAMRVISKEIGENVNIDSVLSQENSWKGRAQQIEVLKARVKELQAKMSSSKDFSDISYITDKSEMGMMANSDSRSTMNRSGAMGNKPKDRREELEALKTQCDALKGENDALNEKIKALNSRKTILEKEIKDLKSEFERSKQILIEKSENDDKYILALKRELEKAKSSSPNVQTRIVYRDKPVEATKRTEAEENNYDDSMAKKELSVLKSELDKREKIIKELISEKVRPNLNKENVIQENMSDQEKIIKLETMIKILKQENEELTNIKLGIKTTTPDSKLIKDLSLQNAQLRRKLDDLQQKLK